MQAVVGETVKLGARGSSNLRYLGRDFYLGGVARLTLIDGCMENRRFWRCALAPMRVPLNG